MKNRESTFNPLRLTSRDSSDNRLTEKLGRIWAEYPNGLLDLDESAMGDLDPAALAVDEQDGEQEEEEAEVDRSKPMPYNDMQRLRDELFDQLKYVCLCASEPLRSGTDQIALLATSSGSLLNWRKR